MHLLHCNEIRCKRLKGFHRTPSPESQKKLKLRCIPKNLEKKISGHKVSIKGENEAKQSVWKIGSQQKNCT